MSGIIRIFTLITAIWVYGCASTPTDEVFDSPVGKWNIRIETFTSPLRGTMTFAQDGKVTYTVRNGRIFFDDVDELGNWKGIWVEDAMAGVTCSETKDGSVTWGIVKFKFNQVHTRFQGSYDLCGEEDGARNSWQGSRI